jgi:hypothetical protein
MTFSVSVEEFYGSAVVTNMATLLGIPAWRIKVVDVHSGSTNALIEISDESNTTTNTAETVDQVQRLVDIAVDVKNKIVGGEFDVGLPVEGLKIGMSIPALIEAPQDPNADQAALAANGMGDSNIAALAGGDGDDDSLGSLVGNMTMDGNGTVLPDFGGINSTLVALIQSLFDKMAKEGIQDLSGQSNVTDDDNLFIYTPPGEEEAEQDPGFFTMSVVLGIVIGAAVALVAIGVILYIYMNRKRPARGKLASDSATTLASAHSGVEFHDTNPTWARGAMPGGRKVDSAAADARERAGVIPRQSSGRSGLSAPTSPAQGTPGVEGSLLRIAPRNVRGREV